MSTVILCNRLAPLRAILKRTPGSLRYISLVETQESRRIRDYLDGIPNAQELPRTELARERSEDYKRRFVEFMGRLNESNHSLLWWAMPFTDKHALLRSGFRNTAYFLLIVELLKVSAEPLVVITDSADLAAQLRVWAKPDGGKVVDRIRAPRSWKGYLKKHTPAGALYAFLRTLALWLLSRRYAPSRSLRDGHLLVATQTHLRSFDGPHGYRDAYFGTLIDRVANGRDKALILALFLGRPFAQLKNVAKIKAGPPIVPMEACLTLGDLMVCAARALLAYLRPVRFKGPAQIDGLDLSCLVKRAVRESSRSGNIFMSLRVYYCARRLARRVRIERCIYPYENRAWEKMLLLGTRSSSPDVQMVGYQHAAVTSGHTNFMLRSEEAMLTPLPDTVLTTGDVTKAWLAQEGHYPAGMRIKTACALRQGRSSQDGARERRRQLSRILVALATNLDEYVGTLAYLEKAVVGSNGYDLRIRPHPTISLESAIDIAPLARRDFYSPSTGSLEEDLQWADVVLYASSTVGMEAVSQGIPAIYLDQGDFLESDPMFGWDEFKWRVARPPELIDTIKDIEAIPETRFSELQRKGKEYVASYLSPVTDGAIGTFLES